MTLYEKFQKAQSDVRLYKNPDIRDFQSELDNVLEAAGLETTFGDKIEYIDSDNENIYIGTSYSVRCCDQTNTITVPLFLIEAPDPLKAAFEYKRKQKITSLKNAIDQTEKEIKKSQEFLDGCKQELAQLTAEGEE